MLIQKSRLLIPVVAGVSVILASCGSTGGSADPTTTGSIEDTNAELSIEILGTTERGPVCRVKNLTVKEAYFLPLLTSLSIKKQEGNGKWTFVSLDPATIKMRRILETDFVRLTNKGEYLLEFEISTKVGPGIVIRAELEAISRRYSIDSDAGVISPCIPSQKVVSKPYRVSWTKL
jgi:hypothetical protein